MLDRRILAALAAAAAAAAQLAACSEKPAKTPPQSTVPTIIFLAPAAGSHLHGVVSVTATATGAGRITALTFTAPEALGGASRTLDATTGGATLTADLDLGAFPDGPLTITAAAKDEFGATSSKDLLVNVARRAPVIAVAQPAPASVVRGVVTVEATAAAQAGATIAALDLVDPPAGCGTVVRGEGTLTIPWDTTLAPEGPAPLHLRAVDSLGLVSDQTLVVTVDNVPFGRIEALVSAGTPIKDAAVEVWALDDATGLVSTAVGADGLLGMGGPTDADGRALVTLSTENYRGPISVVARPPAGATLAYLDPAPPTRTVQIPAALPLSSVVARYATGARVTVPVTLWTTLADAEIDAYVAGAHRMFPTRHTVTEAAAFGDPLFSAHLQASAPRWDVRTAGPTLLTAGAVQGLGEGAYAALPDVALAQLARDLGAAARAPDAVTAPSLVQLLRQDLAADGQLDGRGAGGAQLKTPGVPPVLLDEDTLRTQLAVALDEFVRSPSNLSGLDRATLDAAGVYTTIAEDVSPLFGPRPPTAYDREGPALSVDVTCAGEPPVGPRHLVRRTVRVEITATDPAGIEAVALGVDGVGVPGTLLSGADGAGTLVAEYDTAGHADGLVALAVSATDRRGNARTIRHEVTIDNTGPDVAVEAPDATWRAGAIPLVATASDATSGVASCVELARGIGDDAAAPERYAASWTPAADVADGELLLSFRACDLAGNCTDRAATARRDTTPPTVREVSAPAYTSDAAVTITARVEDAGAGVRAVYATNGVHPAVAGTRNDGTDTWTIPGVALEEGANGIMVWATDLASPTNGSNTAGRIATVVRDTAAPLPFVADLATYLDERELRILKPTAPPEYWTRSSSKVDPAAGGIYKAASRLGWTTPPTVAELEGANRDNIPFLRVGVPIGPTQAPIVTARYTITVDGVAATGDLAPWQSGGTAAVRYYDVPISSNLAPALASGTTATRTVTVTATFTDAVGLTGEVRKQLPFTILAPPVFVQEDAGYATLSPRNSTHFYRLSGATYHQLWDPNTFPGGIVRLVRVTLRNPARVPVAVWVGFEQALGGPSWRVVETWRRAHAALVDPRVADTCSGPYPYVPDAGAVFDGYGIIKACQSFHTATAATSPPCWGASPSERQEEVHLMGNAWTGGSFYDRCLPASRYRDADSHPITQQASSGPVQLETYLLMPHGELLPPQVNGMALVPAASDTAPGTLVVYLVRTTPAARANPMAWNAFEPSGTYQQLVEVFRWFNGSEGIGPGTGGWGTIYYRNFVVMKGWADLVGAAETVSGSLAITTQGYNETATFGPAEAKPPYPVHATFEH